METTPLFAYGISLTWKNGKVKEFLRQRRLHTFAFVGKANGGKGGEMMKEEEKKPITWEAADPKLPVIQSGHMENRKRN